VETLADRIARDGPLNELDAVGWLIRLTKKLEALHKRGQAHGAISPAALKTASVPRTSLGMLVDIGAAPTRLEFQSPERLTKGGASSTDDTWAAAATLYALLTGSSPFAAADEDAVRQKILSGSPAPLATFDVGDDDLQHILDAALTREIGQRASTMTALRQALESWHPDPTVKELPPVADDQPEDDDEDERTVMRPVAAMQAVRAAAAAKREPGPPPPPRPPAQTVPNMQAVSALAAATVPGAPLPRAHDLLEDDDDNAKTSLMKVPLIPMRKPMGSSPGAPASTGKPAPARPGAAPPGVMQASAIGAIGRAPGGMAARAANPSRSNLGAARPAPPVPVAKPEPSGFISREAVIDDGEDDEATVMREAPIELLMQTTNDTASEADRATPVNPISAEVAAASEAPAAVDRATPIEPKPDDAPEPVAAEPTPEARAPEPTMLLPEDGVLPTPNPEPQAAPPRAGSLPDLFGGASEERPMTPAEQAARDSAAMPQPAQPAPMPLAAPVDMAAAGRVTPPPLQAPMQAPAPEPSAAKGLLLGILIALLILAAGAGVYFMLLKK